MIDLTPVYLEEAEQFVFYPKRVVGTHLPLDLTGHFYHVLAEIKGDRERSVEILQEAVDSFNANHMASHSRGILASAILGASFTSGNAKDWNWSLEVWVDYRGVRQETVDTWPEFLRAELYSKYLPEYRELADPSNMHALLQKCAARYLGQRLTEDISGRIANDIKHTLESSRMVSELKVTPGYRAVKINLSLLGNSYVYQIDLA